MNYRDSLFFAATQNTREETIFIWDLYQKRSAKITEDKNPDIAEGQITYKNWDVNILAFSWLPNSCRLNTLIHSKNRNETHLVSTDIGLIERRFAANFKQDDNRNFSNDTEKFNLQVNLNKTDKNYTHEKLPINILGFIVDEKENNRVFGMNHESRALIDLKDSNSVKYFGPSPFVSSSNVKSGSNLFHIGHNNENEVIFAKSDMAMLYDIRKV